jgi:hypothetical protein
MAEVSTAAAVPVSGPHHTRAAPSGQTSLTGCASPYVFAPFLQSVQTFGRKVRARSALLLCPASSITVSAAPAGSLKRQRAGWQHKLSYSCVLLACRKMRWPWPTASAARARCG